MGILDSGSAPPTYVEPGEDRIKQGLFGLKMAEPFNQSFMQGMKMGDQRRQFDLEKPMREAQISKANADTAVAGAHLESLKLQNQVQALGAAKNLAFEQQKADAIGFEATLDGKYDGQNRVSFLRFLQQKPDLVGTPWAQSVEKRFDTFEVLDKKAQDAERRLQEQLQSKEDIARILAEDRRALLGERTQATKDAITLRAGYKAQADTGTPVVEGGVVDEKKLQEAAQKQSELRAPVTVRKADAQVEELKKNRPDLSATQLEDAKQKYMANAADPPEPERKALIADDEAARGLASVQNNISKFNAKFGADAFDKFTGPIEGRIQQFKSNYKGFTSEDEKLARSIGSQVEQQIQGYRKGNFGTALTGTELARFKRIVDDPDSASYMTTINSFKESLSDSVARRLENFPYSQKLPTRMFQDYKGRKQGDWFMGGSDTNALPKGWKLVK